MTPSIAIAGLTGSLGTLGAVLLAVGFIAALLLNCVDKSRKAKNRAVKGTLTSPRKNAAVGDDSKERCSILFGTQTGTAERFAKSLKSQLESKFGANTAFDVIDVEHYDREGKLAKEKFVIFVMATYGDGEPTDNATDFMTWLVDKAEGDGGDGLDKSYQDVNFAVFGLGNRQYEHFCAIGKKVHKAMLKLGAYPVVDVGTGDDDVDIDADFDSWCSDLFESLDAKPILEAGEASALTASAVPAYHIEMIADAPVEAVNGRLNGSGTSQASPHLATISVVKELHTSSSDRSCVHVEIDISRCSATYESGDHVGIFAENSPEVVSSAAKVLRYPVETCFKMSIPPNNADGLTEPPSGPVTLGFVLARYADLLSSPSKASLAALAAFATDPEEAARLSALASIEGRDAYYSYVSSSKRSLLEIMEEFRSLRIPLGAFFATVAPRLQPRFYSISSSPALHPRSVHVTAAVVKDKMPTGRIHEGVATTWLARSTPGKTVVPIFLRRSAFKLPRNLSTPVVMVGPGTGLAPFRGFIQERAAARSRGEAIGPAVLYFGCRRRDHDYIYKEELEFAVASGALTALNVAFSREGDVKDYVQHHMARQGAEIWDLLGPKGKGYLYVCGDAKNMAKDVHNTLLDIAGKVNGGKAHAEASIRELLDSGRYLKDVW